MSERVLLLILPTGDSPPGLGRLELSFTICRRCMRLNCDLYPRLMHSLRCHLTLTSSSSHLVMEPTHQWARLHSAQDGAAVPRAGSAPRGALQRGRHCSVGTGAPTRGVLPSVPGGARPRPGPARPTCPVPGLKGAGYGPGRAGRHWPPDPARSEPLLCR